MKRRTNSEKNSIEEPPKPKIPRLESYTGSELHGGTSSLTGGDRLIYICNGCNLHRNSGIETRYHCIVCKDYNLCETCNSTIKHEHLLEKMGFSIGGDESNHLAQNNLIHNQEGEGNFHVPLNTIPPSPANIPPISFRIQSPYTPINKIDSTPAPNVMITPAVEQQNLQRIMEAYISINPTDGLRAREYLHKHPNLVPRLIEMLQAANKLNEATQLKREFSHSLQSTQVPFNTTPPNQPQPINAMGGANGSYNTSTSAGTTGMSVVPRAPVNAPGMPQQTFQSTHYGNMVGPHRTPSPAPMYNGPIQPGPQGVHPAQFQNRTVPQNHMPQHIRQKILQTIQSMKGNSKVGHDPAPNVRVTPAPNVRVTPELNTQENMQRIMEAYISTNPTDGLRAREYLRMHTNLVPRLIEMLQATNKLNEATQLKREFSHSLQSTLITPPNQPHGSRLNELNKILKKTIKDRGSFMYSIVQCMPFGLPRAGKTSLYYRLLDKRPLGEPATLDTSGSGSHSTDVLTERKMIQAKVNLDGTQILGRALTVETEGWTEVSNLEDEITIYVEAIKRQKVQQQQFMPSTASASDVTQHLQHSRNSLEVHHSGKTLIELIIGSVMTAEKSLESSKVQNILDKSITIFFTDCGGQPEFQEVLPALAAGPTIFILVFNLVEELKSQYRMKFLSKDNVEIEYPAGQHPVTVEDVLAQCLSSISSFHDGQIQSYEQMSSHHCGSTAFLSAPPTNVLVVGTHSDLVTEAKAGEADAILMKNESVMVMKEGKMIEYFDGRPPTPRLVIPVNNFCKEEDHSKCDVRAVFERVVTRKVKEKSPFTVEIPATWLFLELHLRRKRESLSIVLYDECFDVAKILGITNEDEFDSCLWFLHHQVGTIRRYKEVKKLENTIIIVPNLIFKAVTELIVYTFNPDDTHGADISKFRSYGLFKTADVKHVFNDHINEPQFTFNQFIALLEHLNILGSAHHVEYDYFLPCALAHAPSLNDHNLLYGLEPLLVSFKSGFVPKGVFSGMLAHLCKRKRWDIQHDCSGNPLLYRNQATLVTDAGHSITIRAKVNHLEFFLRPRPNGTSPGSDIYCGIREELCEAIHALNGPLGYLITYTLGVYCSCGKEKHFAEVELEQKRAKCSITNIPSENLGPWFTDVVSGLGNCPIGPVLSTYFCLQTNSEESFESSIDGPSTYQSQHKPLDEYAVFNCLRTKTNHWNKFAREFRLERNLRQSLERDRGLDDEERLEQVIWKWIEKGEDVSWERLLEILEALEFKDCKKYIQDNYM